MSVHEHVTSLLAKHRLNAKAKIKIDDFVNLLSSKLRELDDLPTQNFDDQSILESVKLPLNDSSFKVKATFTFKPPTLFKVGSYQLDCLVKDAENVFAVDLALEIPVQCFQKHDYRNYIYHRKRAFYLAYVAKKLQSLKEHISSIQFTYHNGDHLKPILVLTPAGKLQKFCQFNLFPFTMQDRSFVFRKFTPDKCNIQSTYFDSNLNVEFSPLYNSSILKDLAINYYSQTLAENLSGQSNVSDALALLRIWLEKRGLRKTFAHILTVYTICLLKNNSINTNLSGFQIFKFVLQNLISSNWTSKGVAFDSNQLEADNDAVLPFRSHFQVLLIDLHCNLNLCSNITIDLYDRLKYDANHMLSLLNDFKADIHQIFGTRIDFYSFFDHYVNISTDCIKQNFLKNELTFLDSGFNAIHVLQVKVLNLIKLAVGDRLSLLQHKPVEIFDRWAVTSSPPNKSNVQFITFGLIINREKAFDAITKGPLANRPEAAAFRDLWGEKSEIRRFQNGDICEAVFWDYNSQQEKRKIIIDAIKYVLNRKMHLKMKLITSTFGFVDHLLELKCIKFDDEKTQYGTGESFINSINQCMIVLKKYIHNLSDLTFTVVDVVGVDPLFRSTVVFAPLPINSKPKNAQNFCNHFDVGQLDDKIKYIKPIEIMLKAEAATKLFNNIEAIQNQKYLLHYELGRVIAKAYNLFVRPTPSFVDIFFEGFVFRVLIAVSKEASIHREIANKAKAVKTVICAEADEIEFRTLVLPAISSCLASLSKENVSFALTCRLLKRWLSLQMVGYFFNDITIDLLVAYAYNYFDDHHPVPNAPLKGLMRVLKFIVEFDFTQNPIIVNFNQTLSFDKVNDIKKNFIAERPQLPAIFIVTPYDRKLSHHTRSTPSPLIVFHVKKLANALLSELTCSLSAFKMSPLKNNLKPSMSMFDIVIELNTKTIFNKFQSLEFPADITIKQSLYSTKQKHSMPITDFNPATLYLDSLKEAFSNLALFFYDEFGGRQIGVLLRPGVLETRPFKYSNIECSSLTNTAYSHSVDNVALSIGALLEDFQILGEGIVHRIALQSNKLLQQNT